MTIIDANVLVYAYNVDAPQQKAAERWLAKLLRSGEAIGLPWVSIWAFIRISTNSRLWSAPRAAQDVFAIVAEWLAQPDVVLISPGPLHAEILERLVRDYSAGGPLVTDAVLAALAIEYGAFLSSADQDFRRFPEVRWIDPLNR